TMAAVPRRIPRGPRPATARCCAGARGSSARSRCARRAGAPGRRTSLAPTSGSAAPRPHLEDSEMDPQPFQLRKLGHVVLNVTDIEASIRFYTEVLGLEVSDRYPDTMVPGGMVFMRFNTDHHGIALVGGARRG